MAGRTKKIIDVVKMAGFLVLGMLLVYAIFVLVNLSLLNNTKQEKLVEESEEVESSELHLSDYSVTGQLLAVYDDRVEYFDSAGEKQIINANNQYNVYKINGEDSVEININEVLNEEVKFYIVNNNLEEIIYIPFNYYYSEVDNIGDNIIELNNGLSLEINDETKFEGYDEYSIEGLTSLIIGDSVYVRTYNKSNLIDYIRLLVRH
ncbi:MAG: hypothetical protein WC570_00925 [Patescibacteria group bacterium]